MAKTKIEDTIADLESYFYNCKNAPLSTSKIVCEKEILEEYLSQLKSNLPKELAYCRDVMARAEAIELEARERADKLIKDTKSKTFELLSESEINQQAIKRAEEIIADAGEQGQIYYDSCVQEGEAYKESCIQEGNMYRESAMKYLDDMLRTLQGIIDNCIDTTTKNSNKFLDSLNNFGALVAENLNELNGVPNDDTGSGSDAGSSAADGIDVGNM